MRTTSYGDIIGHLDKFVGMLSNNFLSVVAIIISLLALYFTIQSTKSSVRSASASEKSAEEASMASKINRFAALFPHFINVEHLLNVFEGEKTNRSKLILSRDSIGILRSILYYDGKLNSVLDNLHKSMKEEKIVFAINQCTHDELKSIAPSVPSELAEWKADFEERKKAHLDIGQERTPIPPHPALSPKTGRW